MLNGLEESLTVVCHSQRTVITILPSFVGARTGSLFTRVICRVPLDCQATSAASLLERSNRECDENSLIGAATSPLHIRAAKSHSNPPLSPRLLLCGFG